MNRDTDQAAANAEHSRADHLLSELLAPVTAADFFETYWEKKPLHISRAENAHFSELLSLAQIERVLSSQDLYFPDVQLTQSNKVISIDEYTDEHKKILPQRLIQLHTAGATIVVSQAHRYLHALHEFCCKMQSAFQLRCQANVYFSPAGNQGFKPHYDAHEVFILQVSGKKTFSFYSSGVDLPQRHDTFDSQVNTVGVKTEEVALSAGDTLYIPRGMMHDAFADDNDPSLHVTLGVFPVAVGDLLQAVLQIASAKDVQLRRSLPSDAWAQSTYEHESLHAAVQQLLSTTFTMENVDEAVSQLRDDIAIRGLQDCTGLLSPNYRAEGLQLSSIVTVKPSAVLNTERQESTVRLRILGQVLEFNEPMSTAVEQLLAIKTSAVSNFVNLNDEQKLALGNHLLQANVIARAD